MTIAQTCDINNPFPIEVFSEIVTPVTPTTINLNINPRIINNCLMTGILIFVYTQF